MFLSPFPLRLDLVLRIVPCTVDLECSLPPNTACGEEHFIVCTGNQRRPSESGYQLPVSQGGSLASLSRSRFPGRG